MQLNLPCFDYLTHCQNLLIAGMGGGFDVYCGLPLYFELREAGCRVHLANLSFTNLRFIHDAVPLCEGCLGVTPESNSVLLYAPELHLAHHLGETVWCFYGGGVLPLLAPYRALVAHLDIDGIILIDGGVDSLMRGDEPKMGTIMEDWQSLAAVSQLTEVPLRILATLGYGAENDIDLDAVLANVAALTDEGAFLGACPLRAEQTTVQKYREAVEFTHSRRGQDSSAINASILAAIRGSYGNVHTTEKTRGTRMALSSLTHEYWFFDLQGVARRHLYLDNLAETTSRFEMMAVIASNSTW
jgi:hypothetical protein